MGELRRIERLFEASLNILVFIPFAMIALGGGTSTLMSGVFVVGLIGSIIFHRRGLAHQNQAKLWNIVILAWVALALGDLAMTDTSILDASINIVLVLTLIKLFSRLGERDELQVYALSFLLLAAATTVNEDVTFGVLFGLYVLLGTFSLAIFHLRSELKARPRMALYRQVALNSQYMGVLAAISAMILAASLGIFFVFPRVGLGFFQQQSRDGQSIAGFSDTVELGGHGTIKDNPAVVMRVEFPNGRWPDYESIHWRTITFDTYDGRAWSQAQSQRPIAGRPTARTTFDLTEFFPSNGKRDTIQIYLEPLGTNLLPVVYPPQKVRLGTEKFTIPWSPRFGDVGVTANDDVAHTIRSELGIAYRLDVGIPPTDVADLRPPAAVYLATPELAPGVRKLAHDVAGRGSNEERAVALKTHLQANYQYTLEQENTGPDPLAAFLLETRRGHCEYFASSLVMMLRSVGVPARLVNGFLGGQWNEAGGYLAVRQGDAHSWVEYWSPRRGWVQMDPTPPAGLVASKDVGLVGTMRAYWDAMRLHWMKWVIEYDLTAQIEFFRKAANMLEPRGLTGGKSNDEDDDPVEDEETSAALRHAFVFGGLALLALVSNRHVRRRLVRRRSAVLTVIVSAFWIALGSGWLAFFQGTTEVWFVAGGSAVATAILVAAFRHAGDTASLPALFMRFEHEATARGLERRIDEPPSAYLRRVAESVPELETDLARFERAYLAARFSGRPVELDELADIRKLSDRLIAGIRKFRRQ